VATTPKQHRPTLRSRWLGQRLRELREHNHKTLREVAEHLQRDASSVSRMEVGIHPARIPDVLAYLDFCKVSDAEQRRALLQLAKESRQSGWWDHYGERYESLFDRIWLESQALRIDSFEAMVIPGHVQVRAYAEAVIHASNPDAPAEVLERDLDLRMERQEHIHSDEKLFLNIILDEAVLHRQTGGRAVMREQLLHLAKISDRPRIQIMVLPFETSAHASLDGCFDLIRLRDPFPGVAYVFSPADAIFLEGADVDRLDARFNRLSELALSPAKSKARCLRLARGLAK
jgi:hypothetical protein